MEKKTLPRGFERFAVLIPHRDVEALAEGYKKRLFRAGLLGAYSFPVAAPLGIVSRPLTEAELKALACSVRALTCAEGRDGKITLGEPHILPYPDGGPRLFGLRLDLPPPEFPAGTLLREFSAVVLCAGFQDGTNALAEIPPPAGFFRAAMIANMVIRPLASGAKGYSFEWKIGVPVWLPKYRFSKNISLP
ncbi:MAG: hypothetical protein LBG87_04755 [Spirochaetaceae bacterium]|jgi:hypothetical protein|nr:hypothetical protein [Spirochaetaceae bacterium]